MPDTQGKTIRGDLFIEALHFYLDVCKHTELDNPAAMQSVWDSYTPREQFAVALALGETHVALAMIKTFVVLQMMLQIDSGDTISDREAAEMLLARRKRREKIAKSN